MKSKLFLKVFGTYVLVLLIALFIVGEETVRQIRTRLTDRTEKDLASYALLIAASSSRDAIIAESARLASVTGARITLIDASGTVITDSEAAVAGLDNHLNRAEIQEARVKGTGRAVRFSRTRGCDTMYVAITLKEENVITGYLRLSRPLTEIGHTIATFTMIILRSLVLVGALSFFIALLFSRRLTAPIDTMVRYTKQVREGTMEGSLIPASDDEMGMLAKNINFMVGELTERLHEAQEERAKLEAAFAGMNDGVLVLDGEGRIEALNAKLKTLFEKRYRDIIGKTPLEAFRNVPLENAINRFRVTGLTITEEIELGIDEPIVLDVTITAVGDPTARGSKVMLVFHDVTRLKKLETMRADFVANVTHEIRTPLTALLGFIETLRDGAIDDRDAAVRFLGIMHDHAERLNRLVDDLLTISDIELGRTAFVFEAVSPCSAVEKVLTLVTEQASRKEIRLVNDIPAPLPPLSADKDRFAQIMINVLDNAIKYTPRGGMVTVSAREDEWGHVIISVADTGIGIPRHEIPRLGERFYRVDKTRSRELGGTGLGLSIVKHLMKAHSGEVTIESEIGRGTTVLLLFPRHGSGTVTGDVPQID